MWRACLTGVKRSFGYFYCRTACSPWRQDKPEDQPFTRQGDQSEGGLDLPETKESDGGGESPLDILARAVLDTSPSGGPKTRSNKVCCIIHIEGWEIQSCLIYIALTPQCLLLFKRLPDSLRHALCVLTSQ